MMRRRSFLRASVATASGFFIGCTRPDEGELPSEDGEAYFPQSVASGDPRPTSVVLWTRVVDTEFPAQDTVLELELFGDEEASQAVLLDAEQRLEVLAEARFDHCVKVRVEGLAPARHYYYRFAYVKDGVRRLSRLGRTRTAPSNDDDVSVRFAFMSCQDYGGRYYNSLAHLARLEVDFVVHLGDYIYETAGDEGFQEKDDARQIVFDDREGVLEVARGETRFLAARSLDNYRQLYRTVRSDRALARVHERFPMLVIWDDHEFSDDCWGSNGTYTDGRIDEHDPERRQNASQAWFEYMPVDYADPEFAYDRSVPPPDDIRIYRDFVFGQHLHLVLGDVRSHRSRHLIFGDAYPGAVALDQAELEASGGVLDEAGPYVEDIDAFAEGVYASLLRSVAAEAEYPEDRITGPISAEWINTTLTRERSTLPLIDEEILASLPRGLAYHHLGKTSFWGRFGSRFLVPTRPFNRLADVAFARSEGTSEDMFGPAQQEWFLQTMQASSSTWKVWGNQFCLMPLQIDLTSLGLEAFAHVFDFTLDDWNGMPNRRAQLIEALHRIGNVVAISGDIHAFFAATPFARGEASARIPEFATGSISSKAMQPLVVDQVRADPVLSSISGAESLAAAIRDFLLLAGGPNRHLGFAEVASHGFGIVDVDADELRTTYYMYPYERVHDELYDDSGLADLMRTQRFRVVAGSPDLHQEVHGEWRRWSPATQQWE